MISNNKHVKENIDEYIRKRTSHTVMQKRGNLMSLLSKTKTKRMIED